MIKLSDLHNEMRPRKSKKRVGRGVGSGVGKTCGRGEKGAGSRSGYKRRYGYEGGGIPLHMRLPKRGFKRGFTVRKLDQINLWQIDEMFNDGESVNVTSLIQKGFLSPNTVGFKVLGQGELSKKLIIEAEDYSNSAREKLDKAKVEYHLVG